jgi:hypothetical protein
MEWWEVAPGLWHWATPHPDWSPGRDWPREVGSAFADVRGEAVLVDPLVAEDGWERLDALVAGRAVHVLTTIRWHERNRGAVLARYGGDEAPPPGMRALRLGGLETLFWFEDHRTLVVGDSIIGEPEGSLRRCPPEWLDETTDADERAAMQPLLELPVERVLVSHGESLFSDAREALAAAVRAAAA